MDRRVHFVLKEMGSHRGLSRKVSWSELIIASHSERCHACSKESCLVQLRVQLCSGQPSPLSDLHQKNTVHGSFRHGGSVASFLDKCCVQGAGRLPLVGIRHIRREEPQKRDDGMMSKPCAGLKGWLP